MKMLEFVIILGEVVNMVEVRSEREHLYQYKEAELYRMDEFESFLVTREIGY